MRASFEVTVEVADYAEAARHEAFLWELRAALEARYGPVAYSFRERRERAGRLQEPANCPAPRANTGRLKPYGR